MSPRASRRTTGPTHTRYVGDAVVRLEHLGDGDFDAEIALVETDDVVWEEPIHARLSGPSDDPEFIDRLAATAVALAIAEGKNSRVRRATQGAEDDQGYVVERGNPEGPTKKNPAMRRKLATVRGSKHVVDVYHLPETDEYLVRIEGSPAGHGYWTDDRNDAMATAKYMSEEP